MRQLSIPVAKLMIEASNQGVRFEDMIRDPETHLKGLSSELNAEIASEIMAVSQTKLAESAKTLSKETKQFFFKVIEDGRYIKEAFFEPAAVSKKLEIPLSEDSLTEIPRIPMSEVLDVGDYHPEAGAAIIIIYGAILIGLIVAAEPGEFPGGPPVIDFSGIERL